MADKTSEVHYTIAVTKEQKNRFKVAMMKHIIATEQDITANAFFDVLLDKAKV